ncbi:hypothetical protein ACFWNH_31075 [Rhodococcus qingshengii]|uniref:hypothetical protein n=1 Tax=Rhodococcus qingshengii TaxID=334542 RepID=UPI00365C3FEF
MAFTRTKKIAAATAVAVVAAAGILLATTPPIFAGSPSIAAVDSETREAGKASPSVGPQLKVKATESSVLGGVEAGAAAGTGGGRPPEATGTGTGEQSPP